MKQCCPHLTTSIYSCKVCSETVQSNIQILQLENQLQACRVLIKEQEVKICELATKLAYANQTIENLTVEEPQEQEPQYLYVYRHIDTSKTKMCTTLMRDTFDWDYLGKVEVIK